MADQKFPKSSRLRSQPEFDRVYAADAFAADDVLVIRGCRNGLNRSRMGLSIGRRVGNAVVRNRWKRLIREAFRKSANELPSGIDIVVRPRKGAVCEHTRVAKSLVNLARRLDRKLNRDQANANGIVQAKTETGR